MPADSISMSSGVSPSDHTQGSTARTRIRTKEEGDGMDLGLNGKAVTITGGSDGIERGAEP
jgi:hypothetical protein